MKNFFKKTTIPRSDLKSQKRSDLGMVKKIILLFVFIGIVFLGGGVGIINAAPSDTATGATAPTQQPATPNSSSQPSDPKTSEKGGNDALDLIQCANFLDKLTNPFGCFLPVTTYYLYVVTTGVLTLSGYLFDSLLGLSINREFIQKDFVNTIWTIMRDFSNMMFIFILIYTGIRTMLFMDDWKKPVMMVVVIALLINFSLFFTKIVIDAGNVLAMGVYSGIGVGEGTSVSAAFTNSFRPEQFFLFSASNKDIASTIFIIAGIISVYLAFVLFKAAFMFMGRILAFWFLMVISPFAFILLAFPQLGAKIKFRFDAWLDMLINQAFVAPVFLFFIYIIMKVIQAKVFEVGLSKPSGAGVLVDSLFMPIVMMGMIIYALKKALSVAESMSGDFGKIGANLGNKVLGLAAGGAGMALTGGVGMVAGAALRSETLKKMTESDNWAMKRLGGRVEQVLKGAHEKPMDFRNISIGGKKLGEHLGIDSFGLKKGYKQTREDKTKRLAGIGGVASEARIAAQTTRKDTTEAAQNARTEAETKAKVAKGATQTTLGKQTKERKDTQRATAATAAGIAGAIGKVNAKEADNQKKKESVTIGPPAKGIAGQPNYVPAQKSLEDKLADMKARYAALQVDDVVGATAQNPNPGTLKSLAKKAEEDFEIAKINLDATPINDPNRATAINDYTRARTDRNKTTKDLEDFNEGADAEIGLTDDQIKTLNVFANFIIMGLLNEKDFEFEIKNNFNISEMQAKEVAKKILKEVINPIIEFKEKVVLKQKAEEETKKLDEAEYAEFLKEQEIERVLGQKEEVEEDETNEEKKVPAKTWEKMPDVAPDNLPVGEEKNEKLKTEEIR
ncbi:MAG: hypothetical protein HY228_01710, partial [Candidatus Yonathbacteria bacterium]|nr:hypothetical protein [Candidatus Yonathbacteria bacterium]